MKIPRVVDSRLGYLSAALFMLVAIAAPAALTTSVSAAVVTNRSLELSSSSANASGVNYKLTFTTDSGGAAGAAIIAFCSDSPITGDTCTAPTGLSVASVTSNIGTTTDYNSSTNTIKYVNTIGASGTHTVTFSGIHNPASDGTVYARLLTYTNGTAADAYDESDGVTTGTYIDEGGFALSITNPINVSAAVRETMTFCVSAATISADCAGATTPDLELGETSGGAPKALTTSTTSTGSIYTQVSTNASAGAVVKIKNGNVCGGLHRQSADPSVCSIAPMTTGNAAIGSGDAKFGMRIAKGSVTTGDITIATNYANATNYGFNYASDNSTGVTSAYGDQVFTTAGAPVDNANATLTFGARANNTTPAGRYTSALSLISTGTF